MAPEIMDTQNNQYDGKVGCSYATLARTFLGSPQQTTEIYTLSIAAVGQCGNFS